MNDIENQISELTKEFYAATTTFPRCLEIKSELGRLVILELEMGLAEGRS